MPSYSQDTRDVRAILHELGIGDFNATMIIPLVFMAPAQSDPDMTQVKLLTKAMQRVMQQMGAAQVIAHGRIDQATADCLHALVGPAWNGVTWFDLAKRLILARRRGEKFTPTSDPAPWSTKLGGLGLLPNLPDVPGGLVTVGLGAYLLYRHFTKGS